MRFLATLTSILYVVSATSSSEADVIQYLTSWMPEDVGPIWTPRMATLNSLLTNAAADPKAILLQVNRECPGAAWTERNVEETIKTVSTVSTVPRWFHETIWSFGEDASPTDPALIQALSSAVRNAETGISEYRVFTNPKLVDLISKFWIRYCVRTLRLFPDERVCHKSRAADSWTLSDAQRRSMIRNLIMDAHMTELQKRNIRVPDFDFDVVFPPAPGVI